MARFGELVRHALGNLMRSRLRAGLTTLGVAIAGGALVAMVAFALGLREQVEAPFQKLGLWNNIEVRPARARGADGDDDAPHRAAVLDDAAIGRFERISGVDYAYPDFRLSSLNVSRGQAARQVFAVGLPREAALFNSFDGLLTYGEYFSLGNAPEVILGERLAEDLAFAEPQQAIGQTVELAAEGLSPAGDGRFEIQQQRLQAKVVGVFEPPGMAGRMGAAAVLLPVDLMRGMPGAGFESLFRRMHAPRGPATEGYGAVVVRAARPVDVGRIEKAIETMGFETTSVLNRLEEAQKFFVFMEVLLAAVGTVALVVAGLGILNTLLMTVMERHQEIGVYKAIGASDGDVRILFLTEAALVGLVGGLAGLALAWLVSWLIQWGIDQYAARQGLQGPHAVFSFPLWLLAGAVAYCVVVSVLSGWYPASRAARVDPIRALRRD